MDSCWAVHQHQVLVYADKKKYLDKGRGESKAKVSASASASASSVSFSQNTISFIHLRQIPPFPPSFPLPFLVEEWKEKKTVYLQQIKENKGSEEFVSSVVADLVTSLHSVMQLFNLVNFW